MTIDDIARLAQTSTATVSLALNNRPGVNAETRRRILAIAEETGYLAAKKEARRSVSQIVKLIAVSKPETSGIHNFRTSFFAEIINSIQSQCALLGYSMIYSIVRHESLFTQLREDESRQPSAGIILLGTYLNDEEVTMLAEINEKILILDRNAVLTPVDTVCINNYMGAYQCAEYLMAQGHREIGYIQSATRVSNLRERRAGFLAALENRKVSLMPQADFSNNSYQSDGADQLRRRLETCDHLPTAFFCENDYNALCLISALHQMDKRVPEDVSVIGFDDVPECSIVVPQLTTVHVDREELARAAVRRIHDMIGEKEKTVSQHITLDVQLIERASAARR